jgi:hypothetical protein
MLITITKIIEVNLKRIEVVSSIEQQPTSISDVGQNQPIEILEGKPLEIIEDVLKEESHSSNAVNAEHSDLAQNESLENTADEIEIEKYEIKLLFLNDFNEWSNKEEVTFPVEAIIDEIETLTLSDADSVSITPIEPFLTRPITDALKTDTEEEEFVSKFNKKEMMREIAQTIFENYKNKNHLVRLS